MAHIHTLSKTLTHINKINLKTKQSNKPQTIHSFSYSMQGIEPWHSSTEPSPQLTFVFVLALQVLVMLNFLYDLNLHFKNIYWLNL